MTTAGTLKDLCKTVGGKLPQGQRVYQVTVGKESHFVISNSPGQAAQAVCQVQRCTDKQVTEAAFEAISELHSEN